VNTRALTFEDEIDVAVVVCLQNIQQTNDVLVVLLVQLLYDTMTVGLLREGMMKSRVSVNVAVGDCVFDDNGSNGSVQISTCREESVGTYLQEHDFTVRALRVRAVLERVEYFLEADHTLYR
jgi:hypothetical protein